MKSLAVSGSSRDGLYRAEVFCFHPEAMANFGLSASIEVSAGGDL